MFSSEDITEVLNVSPRPMSGFTLGSRIHFMFGKCCMNLTKHFQTQLNFTPVKIITVKNKKQKNYCIQNTTVNCQYTI